MEELNDGKIIFELEFFSGCENQTFINHVIQLEIDKKSR